MIQRMLRCLTYSAVLHPYSYNSKVINTYITQIWVYQIMSLSWNALCVSKIFCLVLWKNQLGVNFAGVLRTFGLFNIPCEQCRAQKLDWVIQNWGQRIFVHQSWTEHNFAINLMILWCQFCASITGSREPVFSTQSQIYLHGLVFLKIYAILMNKK